jgi:hypothetical protein
MSEIWLGQLRERDIVWLMMTLQDLGGPHSWVSCETAHTRIEVLRGELRARHTR